MTITAVITILILITLALKSESVQDFFIAAMATLLTMTANGITATAFFIGKQEINCGDLVLVVCFAGALLMLGRGVKIPKRMLQVSFIFSIAIFLSIVSCVAWGKDVTIITASQSWDPYYYGYELPTHVVFTLRTVLIAARLVIFFVLAIVTVVTFKTDDYVGIAHVVLAFSLIHALFGLFELTTKLLFHSTIALKIAQSIFVTTASTNRNIVVRGDMMMVQGFTREGSHFATAMFYSALLCILLYVRGELKRQEMFCLVAVMFLLVLSGAFTSVVCLAVLVVFALLAFSHRQRLKMRTFSFDARILLLVMAVAIAAWMVVRLAFSSGNYYAEKFTNAATNVQALLDGNYYATWSNPDAMPRLVSIVECARVFLAYPLFGIGLGTINPFSAVVGTLCTIGVFGLISWLAFIGECTNEVSGKGSARFTILLFFALGMFASSAGSLYSPMWILLCGLFWPPRPSRSGAHAAQ